MDMVTGKLQGKVAVVTGSGRGIGRCEAMALAREGAMIVVSDFGKDELGRDLAVLVTEEILAAGGKAIAVTENLMSLTATDSIFMHCLPAHRGEEVESAVIDGPKSVIWREAFHRRTTIQSILYHTSRGELKGN